MRRIIRSFVVCTVLFAGFSAGLAAQDLTAEEKKAEKEFYESIQREVDRLEGLLKLEDWQVFYVDSIMTHDYKAMQDELTDLRNKKVSNTDMYYEIQDKWQEKMYVAFEKIFDENQWAKYLKSGAARDKKNRDKRLAKK
jgi:hypothetical protein